MGNEWTQKSYPSISIPSVVQSSPGGFPIKLGESSSSRRCGPDAAPSQHQPTTTVPSTDSADSTPRAWLSRKTTTDAELGQLLTALFALEIDSVQLPEHRRHADEKDHDQASTNRNLCLWSHRYFSPHKPSGSAEVLPFGFATSGGAPVPLTRLGSGKSAWACCPQSDR